MAEWELECGTGDWRGPASPLATVCPECGKPLLARYATPDGSARTRPDQIPDEWTDRSRGMWRFRGMLPLREGEEAVSLGEGSTPLLPLDGLGGELDALELLIKDEGQNPTGSFKDRGLSAAVTRAVLDGATDFVVPSAGNAAVALAAYAARAGVTAHIFIPSDTPAAVVARCDHYGGEIVLVDGLIDECGRRAAAFAHRTGAFNVSTLKEPYRIEGKKTMMLEIIEALGWRAPDAIVYPTGGGTGLIGSWKALGELAERGLVKGSTRMYAVQSTGCAPIVRAWSESLEAAPPWEDARTEAYGLRVPAALGDFLILRALRSSGGGAIAIDDASMLAGTRELGRRGVSNAIEGGATLAAARRLVAVGTLREGETVVLFNTANALVY